MKQYCFSRNALISSLIKKAIFFRRLGRMLTKQDQEVWFTGLIPNANGRERKTCWTESEHDGNLRLPKTRTFTYQGTPTTPDVACFGMK